MARSLIAQPFLTLDTYCKLLNIPIWRFNGIENPAEKASGCDMYWSQWLRDQLALALHDAEMMLANELRFFIGRRYVADSHMEYKSPMHLRYGYIIGAGTRSLTKVPVIDGDFSKEPAWFSINTTDLDIDEIKVLDNETLQEITPNAITKSESAYIITVSQAKLLRWEVLNSQITHLVDNTFPDTEFLKLDDLTVYREHINDKEQASLSVISTACDVPYSRPNSYPARVHIIDAKTSKIEIESPLDSIKIECCSHSDRIKIEYVNYLSGTVLPGYENAVISLAHASMDTEPCGCSLFDARWQRDSRIQNVLTTERINCPFGLADGAWRAWQWVMQNRHGVAIML